MIEDSHITDFKARYGKEISGFFSQAEQQMNLRLKRAKRVVLLRLIALGFLSLIVSIGYKQRAYLNLLLTKFCESDELEAFKTRFGQKSLQHLRNTSNESPSI